MANLTRLVCLAFLCSVLRISNAEGRIAYKKIWNITGRVTYSEFYTSENYHDLTYVNCGKLGDGPKHKCRAVQETQPVEKSCPFVPYTYHARFLLIYPFGSTRLVILWKQDLSTYMDPEKESLSMCTILDLTTCHSKELVIPSVYSLDSKVFFMPYDDSFDIAVLCVDDKYCQYNIDVQGNITSTGLSNLESELYYDSVRNKRKTLRVVASSTDKRRKFYVENEVYGHLRSNLRMPNGSWEELLPFYKNFSGESKVDSISEEDDKYMMNIAADSTAHGRIGIATAAETSAKVWQFDYEGNLKLKASIDHEFFVSYVRVHNTADGGLLLLSMDTGDSQWEKIYDKKYKKYYLTKVAADGNITGIIQNAADPDVNLDRDIKIQLFENDANEYCVNFQSTVNYYLRSSPRDESSEGVRVVMCFKDSDFSANKPNPCTLHKIYDMHDAFDAGCKLLNRFKK